MEFNIFKVGYHWYEGEHEETLLGKNVGRKEFEKNLSEAKDFAKGLIGKEIKEGDYRGKGYSVECLPEYYQQVIWFLTEKKGYVECEFNEDFSYNVDDSDDGKEVWVRKYEEKTEISEL